MKLGLIAMSGVRVGTPELAKLGVTLPQFVNRGEVIASLPSLGLLTVAALTPSDVDVEYREISDINLHSELESFDLVGISSFSAQIGEAYILADRYREAGIPVVLGGLHVSACPDEAALHADSIVVDGAEGAWPRLIEDFKRGQMQARYQGQRVGVFDPEHYRQPRFDLLAGRPYNRVTVQTTRGCPLACEFCAASMRITDRYQQKPIDLVVAEIQAARQYIDIPFFEFADDNTFVDKKRGKRLLEALVPLGIRWFTETDVSIADDLNLLDLLAESGCRQVLIGFESPRSDDLASIDPSGWKRRHVDRYLEAIDRIQSRGVSVNGCFVLGLDHQGPEVFEQVSDFAEESGLLEVQVTVQTPFPGTPLYDRLKQSGRLLADKRWDRCTLFDVNYRPQNMTVAELEGGMRWLFKELYQEDAFNRRKRHFMELVKPML